MKKILVFVLSISWLTSCDKHYVCNCATTPGGLPYKKVYMIAKTDNSAERRCTKTAEAGETCTLE